MNTTPEPGKEYPIRYCTGGCKDPKHHAHVYDVDPVDGPLNRTFLCPGNMNEVYELFETDKEGNSQSLMIGYIPDETEKAQIMKDATLEKFLHFRRTPYHTRPNLYPEYIGEEDFSDQERQILRDAGWIGPEMNNGYCVYSWRILNPYREDLEAGEDAEFLPLAPWEGMHHRHTNTPGEIYSDCVTVTHASKKYTDCFHAHNPITGTQYRDISRPDPLPGSRLSA